MLFDHDRVLFFFFFLLSSFGISFLSSCLYMAFLVFFFLCIVGLLVMGLVGLYRDGYLSMVT